MNKLPFPMFQGIDGRWRCAGDDLDAGLQRLARALGFVKEERGPRWMRGGVILPLC